MVVAGDAQPFGRRVGRKALDDPKGAVLTQLGAVDQDEGAHVFGYPGPQNLIDVVGGRTVQIVIRSHVNADNPTLVSRPARPVVSVAAATHGGGSKGQRENEIQCI